MIAVYFQDDGYTALMCAAANGHFHVTFDILAQGPNMNQTDVC